MSFKIGIMQGRLVPPVDGRIQAFPEENWKEEFELLVQMGDVESAQRLLYGLNAESKQGLNYLNCQGTLHFYRQELGESWDLFNQALQLDPTHLDTLLNIYAPAGSNNKGDREAFFGREIFCFFRLGLWILSFLGVILI